jgi:predicted dehydrogenase
MDRRSFLHSLAASGLLAAAGRLGASPIGTRKYRAAVIGHTGHGNYGHGLDTVWNAFDFVEVVAVADPDDAGRAKAMPANGAKRGYRDYREMLEKEKPDVVSIGPRWLDQRVDMVGAAAEAGAHIYLEKAFARDLAEADQLVRAVRKNKVKLQIAHQMRGSPFARAVKDMLDRGELGTVQEIRIRGKEDRRAGGEDLMVLGSHVCDLTRMFLGDPKWVFAHVTQDGAEMSAGHVGQASEPLGPIAGNQIAAMFAFDNGVHAYFGSKASGQTHPLRFGTYIHGSKAVVFVPNAIYPDGQPYILRSASWLPLDGNAWEKVPAKEDIPGVPMIRGEGRQIANALMVLDLFEAIETGKKPFCSEIDGRWTIEMISGIYQSQKTGGAVRFPLAERRHPLETL